MTSVADLFPETLDSGGHIVVADMAVGDLAAINNPAIHNPGGKVRYKIPTGMVSRDVFSACMRYRYYLEYRWGSGKLCLFIAMNPSTASKDFFDPSCRAMVDFAKAWGYDAVAICNSMAYRSTSPKGLLQVDDPIGEMNDDAILKAAAEAGVIVCAWGKPPKKVSGRGGQILQMLLAGGYQPMCLATNGDGSPKHPLYVARSTMPSPYTGIAA
jgi:hypothetical protein